MKNLKISALDLLDDPRSESMAATADWDHVILPSKEELQAEAELKKKRATKKAEAPKVTPQPQIATPQTAFAPRKRKPGNERSFEDLLKEYNAKSSAKLKTSKQVSNRDFMPDSVELIEVPAISGKILRPSSQ